MKTIKMEQCQFCNNMFGDTKMLKQHQKKTKYCLKIQSKVLADAAKEKDETININKELTCQFCDKHFTTKYLLNIHQRQTKYCLKIQESQNFENIIESLFTCKFCEKKFSTKHFNRHDSTCKKKIKFLLNQKDEENIRLKTEKDEKNEEINRLKIEKEKEISSIYKAAADRAQATIDEIAKKPTYQKNSTKNIQNNLMISSLTPLDLSQARVNSIIDEKYTKNDFYEGQKGAAQVIHKHILTDDSGKSQIVCTDRERGTFHHIDVNGEHVVDYKNAHLIDRVHLPLKRKASKFASEECVKNPTAYKDIVMNESSIRELEIKPGLFNRTMAQLTGKNCARPLITTSVDQTPVDLPLTKEWLLENVKFLTIDHILRGPDGYVDYFLSYPLKDRLEVDYANAVVKFKDSVGETIVDTGVIILTKLIFDSIQARNEELIMEYCRCLNDNFADNGDQMVQLLDYRFAVEKCAEGTYVGDEDGDFRKEFLVFLLKIYDN